MHRAPRLFFFLGGVEVIKEADTAEWMRQMCPAAMDFATFCFLGLALEEIHPVVFSKGGVLV